MKKSIFLTFIILLTFSSVDSIDFKISKVIDVGPIFTGPMTNPAKFSPDGNLIVYFNDNKLFVSDTMGISKSICEIDLIPYSFEWISNTEILLYSKRTLSSHSNLNRLTKIVILTGQKNVVKEFTHTIFKEDEQNFTRPQLTFEGNVYYYETVHNTKTTVLPQFSDSDKIALAQNHILRTGTDALYLVKADNSDSLKISNKRYEGYMGVMPLLLNKDSTHILYHGALVRLEDDYKINLDTINKTLPIGTEVCGYSNLSFNPVYPEFLFRRSCDDGHSYAIRSIGVFNYENFQYILLDTVIGMTNCNRPIYAPDGLKIAFIADGELHLLYRELINVN